MSALDNIILVTGVPRSGTAMTAGIINLCGAFCGNMREPPKDSGRPVFENEDIYQHIMEPYLRSIHTDPRGQRPLPELATLVPILDLRQRVEKFLYAQHYDGQQKVFFKSPLIALTWPLWKKAFPNAKWVIVRRADEDIIYSCMHTGFMDGYRTKQGWRYWISIYKRRFQEIHDAGRNIADIWPTQFVEGNFTEMRACIKWLSLKWDAEAVKDFIKPELFYNGVDDGQ